jgi:hypothetical protein
LIERCVEERERREERSGDRRKRWRRQKEPWKEQEAEKSRQLSWSALTAKIFQISWRWRI